MSFLKILKEIDFFGKSPEFYINGKPKKISYIGRIFTFIFIIIYIIIFVYKLYRMFRRVDITFYDSYSYADKIPSIQISNENFYLIFTLSDGDYQPFIDETIYHPIAYFIDEEIEEIQLERCNLEKIGSKYRSFFNDYQLDNYYCLKNVNYTFKSYSNSIKIKLFPCKNNTENNNHCKPKEIIDEYLNGRDFTVYFEDILITPLNYNSPVKESINQVFTTIYKTFGQYVYLEMELVNIETLTNIIGFEFLSNPKFEEFIKYYSVQFIPQPGYDLNDESNDYPVCEIEFQLNDKILYEKREYIKFIDILGEVGGFMEIIYSFFGFICNFIVTYLYEITIVNNLFKFDIHKKKIILKIQKQKNSKIDVCGIENENDKNCGLSIPIFNKKNETIVSELSKDKNREDYLFNKNNILETASFKNENRRESIRSNNKFFKDKTKSNASFSHLNQRLKSNFFNIYDKNYIIDNIKISNLLFSLCSCKSIKRKNLDKILLDEAMNIVGEKLDIFYIFGSLFSIKKENYEMNVQKTINMSKECTKKLINIKNV